MRSQTPSVRWKRRASPPPGWAKTLGLPLFRAHLLYNRGIRDPAQLDPFIAADSRLSNDPFLLSGMDKAVARLKTAISTGETIGVFGDFDTDGVAGTAIMVNALRELGVPVVSYLPDRVDEGHGLNSGAIQLLYDRGVSLLVTVDCGISSAAEVGLATSLGLDTIVTDHHTIPDSPPAAEAVLNPMLPESRYPYLGLTGTGLAFKLVEALSIVLDRPFPQHLLELVALGTVADMGPLTGENRFLVKNGLRHLNATQHPGLRALIARSGVRPGSIDTEALSFGLIPRLNAAGRMGSASLSLDLLTSSNPDVAGPIADRLELLNDKRRAIAKEALRDAVGQVAAQRDGQSPIIFVEHEEWPPGILGLIAGNLSEQYHRPVIALQINGPDSRASGRSIPELDIAGLLRGSKDLFQRFGGHPQAAGFTIDTANLPRLKRELTAAAEAELQDADLTPSLDIDCEISPALLDEDNLSFIESLSPFGAENPAPVFLTEHARMVEARQVGTGGDHLKMRLSHSGSTWEAIAFRQGHRSPNSGQSVDIVYTAARNDWGGRNELQLNVLDFRARH